MPTERQDMVTGNMVGSEFQGVAPPATEVGVPLSL